MPDGERNVLYDGPPIWGRMVAQLLLGIGGIVLVPIGLLGDASWLLVLAVPLLLAGLALYQTRVRITVERRTGVVCVAIFLLGLRLRERRYAPPDVVGLELKRMAGAERERPSDTWYLNLQLRTRTLAVGKYASQVSAFKARRDMKQVLEARPHGWAAGEIRSAAADRLRDQPESADGHYQMGLALLRSGDTDGARREFQKALALTQKPLLRRMIEQRLAELDKH